MISRLIIIIGAILCFGATVYLWTYLGGIDTKTPITNALISIPMALGIIALVVAIFRSEVRIMVIICGAAACGAIFLAEGAARMGLLHSDRYAQLNENLTATPKTVAEVVDELNASGQNAVPAIFPRGLYGGDKTGSVLGDVLPLGGIANRTTVLCNETGSYLVYDSDELGFNNPAGIWSNAPVDILIVGDSFSQGACVAPGESFVDLIRTQFPKTITLGMSGNGPLAMLASLKEYLPTLRPKLVIWAYYEENDLSEDLPDELHVPLLIRYLDGDFSQNLYANRQKIDAQLQDWLSKQIAPPSAVNRPEGARPTLVSNIKSIIKLGQLRNQLNIQFGPSQTSINTFDTILSRAKELIDAHNSELIFLNLPGLRRYSGPVGSTFQDLRRERVFRIVSEKNIPIADAADAFDAFDNPASMFLFHYTAEGNRVVSEHALNVLMAKSSKLSGY